MQRSWKLKNYLMEEVFTLSSYVFTPPYAGLPLPCCEPDVPSLSAFYQKHFLRKAMSVYKWNVPDYWNFDYFLYTLYVQGFVAVLYTNEYGLVPQRCGLLGWKLMEEPEGVFIANQFMTINHRSIGDKCELFRINGDFSSMMETINFYSVACAKIMSGILVNIDNTKLAYLIPAEDKKSADKVKTVLNAVYNGEKAVIAKDLVNNDWEFFTQNVGQNYIVSDLLSDLRKMENDFDTRIGINNTNVEKRERMISDEVNSNNGDTMSEAWERLQRLKKSCDSINEQFANQIMSVDFNEEVVNNGNRANSNSTRNVSV